MKTLMPMILAGLATAAGAADFRDCKELFVSPLGVRTPERKASGLPWDEGSAMDPELLAKPKERADVGYRTIGPKQQDTNNPSWNELFVQPDGVGTWLPVRVGDVLELRLIDRDALADDLIAAFEVTIPKSLAETGVAFVRGGSLERAPTSLRISATDGKRTCSGVTEEAALRYVVPPGTWARPDRAVFASIAKHNRCSVNKSSPACRLESYRVMIADVSGDGVPDTLGQGGPFGEGTAEVAYFALGFEPNSRKEIFVGDCEKTGFLRKGKAFSAFTCTSDSKTMLVPVDGSPVREATAQELSESDTNEAEALAAEARTNLKGVYVAQRAFFAERDRFGTHFDEIGYSPENGNRFAYLLAARGETEKRDGVSSRPLAPVIIGPDQRKFKDAVLPAGLKEAGCPLTFGTNADGEPIGLGVTGAPPNQDFIAYAVGNVDEDPDLDCWSIASFERKTKDGRVVPAGTPLHEKSDYVENGK